MELDLVGTFVVEAVRERVPKWGLNATHHQSHYLFCAVGCAACTLRPRWLRVDVGWRRITQPFLVCATSCLLRRWREVRKRSVGEAREQGTAVKACKRCLTEAVRCCHSSALDDCGDLGRCEIHRDVRPLIREGTVVAISVGPNFRGGCPGAGSRADSGELEVTCARQKQLEGQRRAVRGAVVLNGRSVQDETAAKSQS